MKNGALQILDERNRQILEEQFDERHDDTWVSGELEMAAIAYILATDEDEPHNLATPAYDEWTFRSNWWKPKDKIRNLVRAGALIAAEIDRLQRLGVSSI